LTKTNCENFQKTFNTSFAESLESTTGDTVMVEESTDNHYEIDLNSSTLINESFTDTAMEPMEVNFSSSITDSMVIKTRV
jgi:hypothetical protein